VTGREGAHGDAWRHVQRARVGGKGKQLQQQQQGQQSRGCWRVHEQGAAQYVIRLPPFERVLEGGGGGCGWQRLRMMGEGGGAAE